MRHQPRPYQVDCCDAIEHEWLTQRSTLIVVATGLGKSRIAAEVIKRRSHLGRALFLAHRNELVDQAMATIIAETGLRVGREQGSNRAELNDLWGPADQVVVASVQSLHATRLQQRFQPSDFKTVILDEAHIGVSPGVREILGYFDARVLGVTATPDRGDGVALGAVFDSVAYQLDIRDGIKLGFLCDVVSQEVVIPGVNIADVKVTAQEHGKDLSAKELAQIMDLDGPVHAICGPLAALAGDRPTIVFTPSVAMAHHLAGVLRGYTDKGVRAVDGETAKAERAASVAAFKSGQAQFLVNCAVFTHGFDHPATACVAVCRPTKSRSLYAQMIGRGTRIAPGKTDCLVIDFIPEQSGKHKLVTPRDALGGRSLPDDVAKDTKRLTDVGMPVAEALEAAEAAKAERQESERLRDEARKNKLRIQTEYQLRQVDPFGVVGPEDLTGKPATQKTRRTLDAMRIQLPDGTTEKAARNIIAEVQQRRKLKLCSFKQARIFQRRGLSINIPAIEAPMVIEAILANGPDAWRNPTPANITAKWGVAA
jgi:superfamily II DNA or RNA helicase